MIVFYIMGTLVVKGLIISDFDFHSKYLQTFKIFLNNVFSNIIWCGKIQADVLVTCEKFIIARLTNIFIKKLVLEVKANTFVNLSPVVILAHFF